jgi:hypothetical protein
MVTEAHGPLITITGDPAFVAIGHSALDMVTVPLERLLTKPATLRFVDQIGKPAPPWATGFWRGKPRIGDVRKQFRTDGTPKVGIIRYLSLHELLGHGSDEDVLAGKRARIMALMEPRPGTWVDDDDLTGFAKYWRLPFEAYANRLVEAITAGKVRSPYDDDYTRNIPDNRLADLVTIVEEVITPPPPVEPPPTPLPIPPTDMDAIRRAWLEAEAAISAEMADFGRIINA